MRPKPRRGGALESPRKKSRPARGSSERARAIPVMKSLVGTKEKAPHGKTSAAGESASLEESIDTPPPPTRFPPYPKGGSSRDVVRWSLRCRKIGERAAKDPRLKLPTMRKPKDPETTNAVRSPKDKKTIMGVSDSIVSVSSFGQDGVKIQQCSGIIMRQREGKVIVATGSIVVCEMDELLAPLPKLCIGMPDARRTVLEGKLVFFNYHYDLALLVIEVPFDVQLASMGLCPQYDQELFALARDGEGSLVARRGKVKFLDESNYLGRDYYLFLSCEIPEVGTGGLVIDLDGETRGMAFSLSPDAAILSISIINTCIDMWLQFGRIARPLHGLNLRSVQVLDVELQDDMLRNYGISTGFIVDKVLYDSAAEDLGIEYGDVIHSFDDEHNEEVTLLKLELYFLHLGWSFLENLRPTVELKVRVCSLLRRSGRRVTLPVIFGDT